MEKNDILKQEPQTEAVAMENEPGSYVAYLSLDYLDMTFADLGIYHDTKKQEEFIEKLQQELEDVILQRKGQPGVVWSWMWQDAKGEQHRAVEIIPVKAKVAGLQIVTPNVTGYQELRDKLAALELECAIQKRQINMLAEVLKTNNLISERGFRTCFDREPGGLVEQFRKELKETKEAMERGDYKEPAGMKPVKYIGIGNSIFKEVGGQREECIEVVYPDDDDIDEKSLLLSSVMAHADEILNFAGGDEQMHATEERLLKDWMNAYGAGYRDCRTKAVIERSLSGKVKVTFKATFLY